jgi:hypothetical protein
VDVARMAFERAAARPHHRLPHPEGVVPRRWRYQPAVRREGYRRGPSRNRPRACCGKTPSLHPTAAQSRRRIQTLPAGHLARRPPRRGGMALERAAARPRRRIPQPHSAMSGCRRYQLAVWREGYMADVAGMALERAAARPRRRIPQPHSVVADADATSWPSGEKATSKTCKLEWPSSVLRQAPPLHPIAAQSHVRMQTLLAGRLARRLRYDVAEWPLSVLRQDPVAASHSCTVVAIRCRRYQLAVWREGYDRADVAGMALERAAARPRRRIPQPHSVVSGCRRYQLAVWREGYA